ncbi:hypothetical protein [Steroidobacter sp.]|uniref:hypothetical protein n=1 Tax=Steroidobacter sp. TaxID=1978227 RepID=UPI001A56A6CC|nr:hypothetical protein [Steroidobacter sp.]MBL8268746.1 hypothetical protein [Steroidobacter sp.]
MESSNNPYAPSQASLNGGTVRDYSNVWRFEKIVILVPDSDLPDRCVKCNDPAEQPTKTRKVYWHHPGFYAVLLINVILYVIVALIARKTAEVNPGLCTRHKQKRNLGLAIGWGGLLVGIAVTVVAAGDNPGVAMLGILGGITCILVGLFMSRVVYAKRIDDKYVQLKGCGAPFLDALPEFRPSGRDLI